MPPSKLPPITIAGAGSVGCFIGAHLAAAGRPVTLLTRPKLAEAIERYGLHVSDLDGNNMHIGAGQLSLQTEPGAALSAAKIVLVTVKSHDTADMAQAIKAHAPRETIAVSFQNGVSNARVLRETLGAERVVDAMVPFNVVQNRAADGPPRFHRASGGIVLIEKRDPGLHGALNTALVPVAAHDDIDAVLWGKLLMNLNNGVNALSGLPLVDQFNHRGWRRIVARQLNEALSVLRTAGISYAPYEGVPQRAFALALRLPDPAFRLIARRMLSMDKKARSSMWEDLEARRQTEINHLQGEIIQLANQYGLPAPLNKRVLALIKKAETAKMGSPGLSPDVVGASQ